MGLATNCRINRTNVFARKNYFYPDLPKGYQISQFDLPICEHGWVEIEVDGATGRIGMTRIHMEEDAGKLIHDEREPKSYVDLNRTGTPLIEIVSEPDLRSPEEAAAYLKKLHAILRYLDICDGNMQEGSFRCDANISLRPGGEKKLGTRTELKNMNSFRNVAARPGIRGAPPARPPARRRRGVQQTLLWDPDRNQTNAMRGKEEAHDYRYFPDPDLMPGGDLRGVDRGDPRRPCRSCRISGASASSMSWNCPSTTPRILTGERELADFSRRPWPLTINAKKLANWIMTELIRELKGEDQSIKAVPGDPGSLGPLLKMIETGHHQRQDRQEGFHRDDGQRQGPGNGGQGTEPGADERRGRAPDHRPRDHCRQPRAGGEQYRGGKTKVMGFFVGQLMQKTKGQANPALANKLFTRELTG